MKKTLHGWRRVYDMETMRYTGWDKLKIPEIFKLKGDANRHGDEIVKVRVTVEDVIK